MMSTRVLSKLFDAFLFLYSAFSSWLSIPQDLEVLNRVESWASDVVPWLCRKVSKGAIDLHEVFLGFPWCDLELGRCDPRKQSDSCFELEQLECKVKAQQCLAQTRATLFWVSRLHVDFETIFIRQPCIPSRRLMSTWILSKWIIL